MAAHTAPLDYDDPPPAPKPADSRKATGSFSFLDGLLSGSAPPKAPPQVDSPAPVEEAPRVVQVTPGDGDATASTPDVPSGSSFGVLTEYVCQIQPPTSR